MEINDIRDFYAQSLGVKAPWSVTEVKILGDSRRIEVRVECREGTVWTDPETRQQAHVHGSRERRWRHLDTCEYETVVIAREPRLKLPSGATTSAAVPRAEAGGRFTLGMEGHLVEVLLCCATHKGAARLAGITVDEADGVLLRAVARGMERWNNEPFRYAGIDEPERRRTSSSTASASPCTSTPPSTRCAGPSTGKLSAAGNLALPGTKYAWLKTHGDMRLKSAVEFRGLLLQDLQTGTAWSVNETFRRFWSYRSPSWAIRFFSHWEEVAKASGLRPMVKVAEMLRRHWKGLFAHLFHPIANAAAEGLNARIQALRVAARGLPKFETFRARILFHLGKLDLHPA